MFCIAKHNVAIQNYYSHIILILSSIFFFFLFRNNHEVFLDTFFVAIYIYLRGNGKFETKMHFLPSKQKMKFLSLTSLIDFSHYALAALKFKEEILCF